MKSFSVQERVTAFLRVRINITDLQSQLKQILAARFSDRQVYNIDHRKDRGVQHPKCLAKIVLYMSLKSQNVSRLGWSKNASLWSH